MMGLKWGAKVRPHFAHNLGRGTSTACANSGESLLHLQGKKIIVEHLNHGLPIAIEIPCPRCRDIKISTIQITDQESEKACEEMPLRDGKRADVAILDTKSDEIKMIIEILQTHRTLEQDRAGYLWHELSAADIVQCALDDSSDQLDLTSGWRLRDQRSYPPCETCTSKARGEAAAHEEKRQRHRMLARKVCEGRAENERERCRLADERRELEEVEVARINEIKDRQEQEVRQNRVQLEATFKALARAMGYLRHDGTWTLRCARLVSATSAAASAFMTESRCLRCLEACCAVSLARPFCRACWLHIRV